MDILMSIAVLTITLSVYVHGISAIPFVGDTPVVLEIVDVPSNSVLVRVVDSRSPGQRGYMQESNPVTNGAEARRMMKQWAKLIRNGLEKIVAVDAEGKVVQQKN